MFEEYEKRKRRQITFMRSLMDYGMGVIFLLVGFFILFNEKFNFRLSTKIDPLLEKAFGGMCLLYGAWRIYRGYQKNYFK
jgi:threonine/homoserine/homoserine lactone efflux protein